MTNGPLSQSEANKAMANMPGMNHGGTTKSPENADKVPLYPQDAFMEGPMMAMDKEVDKPETFGLPPNWSGFVGGMMTLVRVMPPDQYDKIMAMKSQQKGDVAR